MSNQPVKRFHPDIIDSQESVFNPLATVTDGPSDSEKTSIDEVQKAQARNPLLPVVDQLRAGKHYITKQIVFLLLDVIPPDMLEQQNAENKEDSSIERLLAKLARMVTRMETAVVGSSDTKELKDTFTAMKDMINMINKLKDDIDTERQMRSIEEATVAAFDEVGDEELKKRFIEILGLKLKGLK